MSGLGNPGKFAAPITPSDTTNLSVETRAIYVGVTGNIMAVMNGTPIMFANVPVGILPIQASRINSTGTTASSLIALW